MFEGTDYNKMNRRLRRRKIQRQLSFLWALLIIPLGFVLYFVARSGKSEATRPRVVTMASPARVMPVRHAAPVAPPKQAPRAPVATASSRTARTVATKAKSRTKAKSARRAKARRGSTANASSLVRE